MARGRGGSHKGGRRHFSNPAELEARQQREQKEREWRRQHGDITDSDEDEEESEEDEESSEEESSGEEGKAKGVEKLIEVANPNRVVKKVDKKVLESAEGAEAAAKPELSRREREELEKQRAKDHYNKLQAEGKTDQARADLARLALIRQQRDDAARKKAAEQGTKAEASKTAAVQKTAGTKSAAAAITVAAPAAAKKKGNPRK